MPGREIKILQFPLSLASHLTLEALGLQMCAIMFGLCQF